MKIYFYIFNLEGKQYISAEENNTGKKCEIFLGFVDETQPQKKLIGTLEIPDEVEEKEKTAGIIGKVLITKFS